MANPCTQGFQVAGPNQSGVVFFPGSVPLYRNGVLVGGLGISGDGVDQDDYVAAGGSAGFEAPAAIRADQIISARRTAAVPEISDESDELGDLTVGQASACLAF